MADLLVTRLQWCLVPFVAASFVLEFSGCGPTPDPSEVGAGLQSKLQNTSRIVIDYSEYDGAHNVLYEIDDAVAIQRLTSALASRRGWKEIGETGWAAPRIALVEFRDSDDELLWNCTLLTKSITFRDQEGKVWYTRWEGGLGSVMSVAKPIEKEEGDSVR